MFCFSFILQQYISLLFIPFIAKMSFQTDLQWQKVSCNTVFFKVKLIRLLQNC